MTYDYWSIDSSLSSYRDKLEKRADLAQQRADRLSEAAQDYEEETEEDPTPEEEARLDRILRAYSRAEYLEDTLRERVEKIDRARGAIEDESLLADGSSARRQRRLRKVRG